VRRSLPALPGDPDVAGQPDRKSDAPAAGGPVRHIRQLPARVGVHAPWPVWLPEPVLAAFQAAGISRPWQHQVEAAEAAWQGRHVALSTGTASGKSLGYLMPILASTYAGLTPAGPTRPAPAGPAGWLGGNRPHTALYLSPTKALAHDQLRACTELVLPGWPVAAVDGDTEPDVRAWARDHATYLFTNPDLLHLSLLPGHARWARFLAGLRFVVVDEAHRYRGVFGSQVGLVLRRLRRLAAFYGAAPTFVIASATAADPAGTAATLIGVPRGDVTSVEADRSSRGRVDIVLLQPEGAADDETATLLARSVRSGSQTIAFVPSRRGAELVAQRAQRQLDAAVPLLPAPVAGEAPRVAAYRGGYLAEDRRRLERALTEGRLAGVAATNALELGVDIAGVDAVILSGFPGTRSAFWQQAGRAGRRGRPARVTLVTRPHPVDAYLIEHPAALLDAPVEPTVLHPDNPYLLAPHLAAAAQELPVTAGDAVWFGPSTEPLLERLARGGSLRRRPDGWYWTRAERAVDAIDLRGSRGDSVEIVDQETGRVLGHVDPATADRSVHPGAVYLHAGETFLCEELDHEEREALVRAARPGYLTQPLVSTATTVLAEQQSRRLGRGRLHFGQIAVTEQVTGYLRRDEVLGTVWDSTPLDLPEHRLQTSAAWLTLDLAEVDEGLSLARIAAGAHGLEHLCLALLPMHTACDRWDVRGHSTTSHPDTGRLTVLFYDSQPAGAGFAEQGYVAGDAWLAAALDRVTTCRCEVGCPACVVAPDCTSTRVGLDKETAAALLGLLAGDSRAPA
jgi:DEAD/DEAH box helicase domain-containing protein